MVSLATVESAPPWPGSSATTVDDSVGALRVGGQVGRNLLQSLNDQPGQLYP